MAIRLSTCRCHACFNMGTAWNIVQQLLETANFLVSYYCGILCRLVFCSDNFLPYCVILLEWFSVPSYLLPPVRHYSVYRVFLSPVSDLMFIFLICLLVVLYFLIFVPFSCHLIIYWQQWFKHFSCLTLCIWVLCLSHDNLATKDSANVEVLRLIIRGHDRLMIRDSVESHFFGHC